MRKKFLTYKQFKSIYTRVPRLCVDLVIVKRKKVLLTKRSIPPFKGMWHFPGGSVLYREKITEAIKRIAKTELGIKIAPQKFLGYMEIETMKDGYKHSVSLAFKCKIIGNKQPRPIQQASEINFFVKLPKKIIREHVIFLNKNWKKIFE